MGFFYLLINGYRYTMLAPIFEKIQYFLSLLSFFLGCFTVCIVIDFYQKHPYLGSRLIAFEQVVDCNGPKNFFYVDGWSESEGTHRWSDGKVATLAFDLNKPHSDTCVNYLITVKVNMVKNTCQGLDFSLNDYTLGATRLCQGDSLFQVSFSRGILSYDRSNIFRIKISSPVKTPEFNDNRLLGIAVSEFTLRCK